MSLSKNEKQFEQLSVLIVEDNRFFRSLIRSVLREFGVRYIEEAEDGADALAHLGSSPPDIILLDWYMPVFSGADFMRMFNETKKAGHFSPAVIVVTSNATKKNVIEAAKLGVDGILCKPIVPALLYRRIVEVLPKNQAENIEGSGSVETKWAASLPAHIFSVKHEELDEDLVFLL